jgi:hypothetical protein
VVELANPTSSEAAAIARSEAQWHFEQTDQQKPSPLNVTAFNNSITRFAAM